MVIITVHVSVLYCWRTSLFIVKMSKPHRCGRILLPVALECPVTRVSVVITVGSPPELPVIVATLIKPVDIAFISAPEMPVIALVSTGVAVIVWAAVIAVGCRTKVPVIIQVARGVVIVFWTMATGYTKSCFLGLVFLPWFPFAIGNVLVPEVVVSCTDPQIFKPLPMR